MTDIPFVTSHRSLARYAAGLLIAVTIAVAFRPGLFKALFDDRQFLPHTFCYLRNAKLVWLHGVSDILIGVSYVVISFLLMMFVRRARRDIPFSWIFLAFGTFIIACGATHIMEVITLRVPLYWLAGAVKVVTAVASVATAFVLPPLIPRTLDLLQSAKKSQERLHALERERTARREAEEASRTKDAFLATLSHELRTPMTSILGWSSLLRSGLDETSHHSAVTAIEQSARVQAQLIEDLLDVSRIVAGKLAIEPRTTDFNAVVRSAAAAVQLDAEKKQLSIELVLPDAPLLLFADPARLQQVVTNIVSNAIKFSEAGGKIRIELRRDAGAELTVTDCGIGIAPAFLPNIFDRFTQADSSNTRIYGGLGLGLAIVRHLVELHGGTVEAQSEGEGRGATFIVRLPLAAHLDCDSAAEPGGTRPNLEGLHILLVEDEQRTRDMLRVALAQYGASVRAAGSVSDAMRELERVPPDIVITDIAMPEEDGFVLLERIRVRDSNAKRQTPVVAVSALCGADERSRIALAGFDRYMTKPLHPLRLAQTVSVVAGRAGAA